MFLIVQKGDSVRQISETVWSMWAKDPDSNTRLGYRVIKQLNVAQPLSAKQIEEIVGGPTKGDQVSMPTILSKVSGAPVVAKEIDLTGKSKPVDEEQIPNAALQSKEDEPFDDINKPIITADSSNPGPGSEDDNRLLAEQQMKTAAAAQASDPGTNEKPKSAGTKTTKP